MSSLYLPMAEFGAKVLCTKIRILPSLPSRHSVHPVLAFSARFLLLNSRNLLFNNFYYYIEAQILTKVPKPGCCNICLHR
jgi:hypothetical protein